MPSSLADVADHRSYGGYNYIHHSVSKFDTLPGVAIRYGVDVAEIKRMNGLVTDRQMFALPLLRIPLPGRHPTSSSRYNGAASPSHIDLLAPAPPGQRSSQQRVSSDMNNLQHFYALKPPTSKKFCRGAEDGGCKMRKSNEKSRTMRNDSSDFLPVEPVYGTAEGSVDHRWLKSELDFGWETPEKKLREENVASIHANFASITRKGLTLRPKSASRGSEASDDSEWSCSSSCSGDFPTTDAPEKVYKPYRYSNMPYQEENSFLWFWSNTMRRIRFDLLNLSVSTLTKPLLEGPPIVTCKFKAALD